MADYTHSALDQKAVVEATKTAGEGGAPGRGSGPTGGRAGPRWGDRRAGMTPPIRRPRRVPWARVFGHGVRRGGGRGRRKPEFLKIWNPENLGI